ncbi:MAG: CDP-paratose 2-epimerase [Myxococcales bacterium]|nr:CDP-paratose 2-epimerase [Myxococcales bacterium]
MTHIRLDDGSYQLETSCWVPHSIETVFDFFSDAFNLQALTPDYLNFQILTPAPIEMAVGQIIEYKIRLRGFPMRWRTEITKWDPPHGFQDSQIKGPYSLWLHDHMFREENGGTRCSDRVTYRVPGGMIVQKLLVGRDVERIFAYRDTQMKHIFP